MNDRGPRTTLGERRAALARAAGDLIPLCDQPSGLYAVGNALPDDHRSAAPAVEPIDSVVGAAVLGMSNGGAEWAAFTSLVAERGQVCPSVRLGNGAVSRRTMRQWVDPRNRSWERALDRLAASRLRPENVQIVWMKMGSQLHELGLGPTEERVAKERRWLHIVLEQATNWLPNLRQVYMSSRIYAGYAQSANHLEPPTGFDNGLSVKAVVADSIAGRTPVWVAWGPYLWANGDRPRKDGFCWTRDDYADDGLHPSSTGSAKVAKLLWDFFRTEPLTSPLFAAPA